MIYGGWFSSPYYLGLEMNRADDFRNVFLNTNEFAEEIVYTSKTGEVKTIKAIVKRNRLEPQNEVKARYSKKKSEVYISTDPIYGIAQINIGEDKLSFPEYPGADNSDWIVEDIINANAGMWHLVVGI